MTMHKIKRADKISSALTPYQRDGVDWLKKTKAGLLAYEPGVGKTLTTLATIHELNLERILVIAPASVCGVWPQEINKWLGEEYTATVLRGAPKVRDKFYNMWRARDGNKKGFVVMSYETARSDVNVLKEIEWDAIVLDETIKIQTPTSKTVKAILKLTAPVRIALNGTPISNGWSDIWATFEWLERGSLYHSFYSFRAVHAVMSPYVRGMIMSWRDTEKIKKRTEHLIKRVTKREALKDLPEMTEQVVPCELSPAEMKVYKEIKTELLLRLPHEDIAIENVLVELVRLRQVTNGLFHFEGMGESKSSKLETALELIGQVVTTGSKIIVFSGFKVTIEELAHRLKEAGIKARMITGDVPQEEREQSVALFMSDPATQVLLGTDAMATGLNLQEASYVMNIDLPYSYAKYEQRIGRAWRMGQRNQVTVWNLEAVGTVDSKIAGILSKKISLSDDFTGDSARVGLSRESIGELLT